MSTWYGVQVRDWGQNRSREAWVWVGRGNVNICEGGKVACEDRRMGSLRRIAEAMRGGERREGIRQ